MNCCILRNAVLEDVPAIYTIATHLDTVNLPRNMGMMEEMVGISIASFAGTIPKNDRTYVFVAEDLDDHRIVATSQIIAKHGTPDSPHFYFEVLADERYSSTTHRLFQSKALRLNKIFHGPTEIAGLVVEPKLRRTGARLGRQISYVRFAFMAMYPELFQRQIIAELLPPLVDSHFSPLWDAIGQKFTGMTYRDADLLSRHNKEFILSLFPSDPIYLALLDPALTDLVGSVGQNTMGAQSILLEAGLKYENHIDPFDGGPHLEAAWPDIKPIQATKQRRVHQNTDADEPHRGLIAVVHNSFSVEVEFKAVFDEFFLSNNGEDVKLSSHAQKYLDIGQGESVHLLPF